MSGTIKSAKTLPEKLVEEKQDEEEDKKTQLESKKEMGRWGTCKPRFDTVYKSRSSYSQALRAMVMQDFVSTDQKVTFPVRKGRGRV